MAGDEKTNIGLVARAIFERPERTLGTWVPCQAEQLSFRQWVGVLDTAAKMQGLDASVAFEECSFEAFEEKWGLVGVECGLMFQYYGDARERSFQNTSGLPEVSLKELGVDTSLVSTRKLFDRVDCGALLRQGDDDTPRLGTIGVARD